MNQSTKFIGMDVHKATIAVSVAEVGGEVRYLGEIANTADAIAKLVRQLRKGDARLSFCYEAGPCGYGIHRQLTELGWDCQIVAPSLIPKKAGDRVKTDRRDSEMLARLYRAGELTSVWVPDEAQEALHDLMRARDDMKHLQRQAKQRLLAFLLRNGKRYPGKSQSNKSSSRNTPIQSRR
jgi:transposase